MPSENTATINSSTINSSTRCRLLSLPAELRNRIWTLVTEGGILPPLPDPHFCYLTDLRLPENRVIHMDHKDVWGSVELAPRLNVTMTCKQIQQETDTMFFANNTFLFQAQDRRANYGVLGHAADWLETLSGKQRDFIARIVICSNQRQAMLEWAWVCAGYIELDFGLEIGERLDREVYRELECGKMVHDFEPWGKEDGHYCNKAHYLLAPKEKKGKGKAKHVVEILEN